MTPPSEPVISVHRAADVVVNHAHHIPAESFWRRWFDKPGERHFVDEVRAFVAALDNLLDATPQMLTGEDMVSISADVDRVVKRVEMSIEDSSATAREIAGTLASAVYVIRERYEELYKRGPGGTA